MSLVDCKGKTRKIILRDPRFCLHCNHFSCNNFFHVHFLTPFYFVNVSLDIIVHSCVLSLIHIWHSVILCKSLSFVKTTLTDQKLFPRSMHNVIFNYLRSDGRKFSYTMYLHSWSKVRTSITKSMARYSGQ